MTDSVAAAVKNRTFIAAFTGERDARQKLRVRVDDVGVRCGEIGFSLANIGPLSEQFVFGNPG